MKSTVDQTGKRPDSTQQELRDICWELGSHFPASPQQDGIALLPVSPFLAFMQWNVRKETADQRLQEQKADPGHHARLVVRVYDVTDIVFTGFNAHRQFDVEIHTLCGCYYLKIDSFERNLLTEIGLRCSDGRFVPYARSNLMYFDRPRRSNHRDPSGLFVGRKAGAIASIPHIGSAPLFERMASALARCDGHSLSTAIFANENAVIESAGGEKRVIAFARAMVDTCSQLGVHARLFASSKSDLPKGDELPLVERVYLASGRMLKRFESAHAGKRFDCIQCHNWYSAPAAIDACLVFNLPLVCVLHSTEYQRSGGKIETSLSHEINAWERLAVLMARCVIVSGDGPRRIVVDIFGKEPELVTVVPDAVSSGVESDRTGEIRQRYGIGMGRPLGLFAGEIARHTGADLLMDVLPGICNEFSSVHFVFAGEGPLKNELASRAWNAGLGHRCRFAGDVPGDQFSTLLAVCDFVVIPGRTQLDSGLAQLALSTGKPVLATHQANLQGISHGSNGFLVYDNPGSITWGLREMISNPPGMAMPIRSTGDDHLLKNMESIAANYVIQWAAAREAA